MKTLLLICLLVLACGEMTARGQTPSPTPSSLTPEEKKQVAKWKMEAIKTTYPDGSKATIVFHGDGERVRLTGVVRNAKIYVNMVAPFSYMEASRERVMVVHGDKKHGVTRQIAWDLNQLRGSVRIPNKAAALRYVRLRTTPQTYYFWPNPEVEIVSRRDTNRLPRYGVESDWHFRPGGSGSFGIVSPHAWRVGKFTRPEVQEVAGGFLVTRWTYASAMVSEHASKEAGVYRIREWVGRDGAYRRRTLQIVHKTLPNTSWQMLENEE